MSSGDPGERAVEVHVRNVGGIDETSVTLGPGPNVLAGRNATNRTSFLRAIMAALGSDDVSLKGDADEGEATLSLDGTTYSRRLVREEDGVATGGDPHLADSELGDLFAFLLESNEVRRAVEGDGDLRELIVRPLDADEIEAEIDRLLDERTHVGAELDELEDLAAERRALEAERDRLDDEIDAERETLAETEAAIEAADVGVDQSGTERPELEERLDELGGLRSELEEVRFRIDSQRESVAALRDEAEELTAELGDLAPAAAGDVDDADDLEVERRRLRERKRSLEATINDLRSVVQFNEDRLADERAGLLDGPDDGGESPTDRLLGDGVVCWTCGSEVERDRLEATLDTLRDLRAEKVAERNRVERDLADVRERRTAIDERRQRRDRLERELADVQADIEDREDRVAELTERRRELTDEVEALETEVGELRDREYDDVLELHEEANRLEFELGRLEDERAEVASEIARIDDRLADREELETRRAEIQEELADLRTAVDRIEAEAVEAFNEHMETVLSLLEYENLERIWIERHRRDDRASGDAVERRVFALHVVRSTESGATYEDTVAHLSESEREVTGLVFALAGYLAHDVHDAVPFVLLDSLEAIDSDRIAALVEHLEEYADYLVVALLPEDAAALPDSYRRVTEI